MNVIKVKVDECEVCLIGVALREAAKRWARDGSGADIDALRLAARLEREMNPQDFVKVKGKWLLRWNGKEQHGQ